MLLPDMRWALTPPFHPYQHRDGTGGLFSVALAVMQHFGTACLPVR